MQMYWKEVRLLSYFSTSVLTDVFACYIYEAHSHGAIIMSRLYVQLMLTAPLMSRAISVQSLNNNVILMGQCVSNKVLKWIVEQRNFPKLII